MNFHLSSTRVQHHFCQHINDFDAPGLVNEAIKRVAHRETPWGRWKFSANQGGKSFFETLNRRADKHNF